jgi:hypothetical protein
MSQLNQLPSQLFKLLLISLNLLSNHILLPTLTLTLRIPIPRAPPLTLSQILLQKQLINQWILELLHLLEQLNRIGFPINDPLPHESLLFQLELEQHVSLIVVEVVVLVYVLVRPVVPLLRLELDLVEPLSHEFLVGRSLMGKLVQGVHVLEDRKG